MAIQRWSDDIWVAHLGDDPAMADDLDALSSRCIQAAAMPHVVLELSAVGHVNSSSLSRLLRLRKLSLDRQARLKLVAPSDAVWAVLLATGLDQVFDFSPNTATALAQLQMSE